MDVKTENKSWFVVKRSGVFQSLDSAKIEKRLSDSLVQYHKHLGSVYKEPASSSDQKDMKAFKKQSDTTINFQALTAKVMSQLCNEVPTHAIDTLLAEQCYSLVTTHYEYANIAAHITITNHHRRTVDSFSKVVEMLYNNTNVHGVVVPLVHEQFYQFVQENASALDSMIVHGRDYLLDYFGLRTLLSQSYLLKIRGVTVERPQHMWMRVAVSLYCQAYEMDLATRLKNIQESYNMFSMKMYTHATPTLLNSGGTCPQLSSCFLTSIPDSIAGIFSTLGDCAKLSKYSGGLGLHVHDVRASGTEINGTNGKSTGLCNLLRVYNNMIRYVDQGGGKRQGSLAVYVELWHLDIFTFLQMKRNQGEEDQKARDLFYGLWVCDLFMERVQQPNAMWSLFCPHECPGLSDVYGEEFRALYTKYEREIEATMLSSDGILSTVTNSTSSASSNSSLLFSPKRRRIVIPAMKLWQAILESQIETGGPYMLYKDAVNRKSNQSNVGVIRSSNLCCEIVEYTHRADPDKQANDHDEVAVCNLASIGLPTCVKPDKTFDFQQLHHIAEVATRNLNRVIDLQCYVLESTARSNQRHRPVGLGVQGLADVFLRMNYAFDSEAAMDLNRRIFETILHGALTASCQLAQQEGAYATFAGSPASQGVLQPDMWLQERHYKSKVATATTDAMQTDDDVSSVEKFQSDMWDWDSLRTNIQRYGLRNSLLTTIMPTASTSQILSFNECVEPITSNLYTRRTLAGEFVLVNKYLMRELLKLKLWNVDVKDSIVAHRGSVQQLEPYLTASGVMTPEMVRAFLLKYRTVWELPMRSVIDMSADRGLFICQSQSLNLWKTEPTYKQLSAMHVHGWQRGLKTGMYYLRRRPVQNAQQFSLAINVADTHDNQEVCASCTA